jgi:hypothetical protein
VCSAQAWRACLRRSRARRSSAARAEAKLPGRLIYSQMMVHLKVAMNVEVQRSTTRRPRKERQNSLVSTNDRRAGGKLINHTEALHKSQVDLDKQSKAAAAAIVTLVKKDQKVSSWRPSIDHLSNTRRRRSRTTLTNASKLQCKLYFLLLRVLLEPLSPRSGRRPCRRQ